jgi:hypothetical protein
VENTAQTSEHLRAIKEMIEASQAKMLAEMKDMKANQAKADVDGGEMLAKIDANQKEMTARSKAKIEANQAKTDVNLKEMREEI